MAGVATRCVICGDQAKPEVGSSRGKGSSGEDYRCAGCDDASPVSHRRASDDRGAAGSESALGAQDELSIYWAEELDATACGRWARNGITASAKEASAGPRPT